MKKLSMSVVLPVAMFAISAVLGLKAGMTAENAWVGIKIGGAFAFGAGLLTVGLWQTNKSDYRNPLAKVLYGLSCLGVSLFGLSLLMSILNHVFSLALSSALLEWGLKIGAGMFVGPMLLVALYYTIRELIKYIDEHRVFSAITIALAAAVTVAMYLVTASKGEAASAGGSFLFCWAGINIFLYAWRAVEDERNSTLWRIGFAFVIALFGCGMVYILSQLMEDVPALHDALSWVVYKLGELILWGFFGYLGILLAMRSWHGLVRWAH